jgi:hypothetical protein
MRKQKELIMRTKNQESRTKSQESRFKIRELIVNSLEPVTRSKQPKVYRCPYLGSWLLVLGSLMLVSCSKNEIAPQQKDTFVKFFGAAGANSGADVKQTADGGYIVLGTYASKSKGKEMYLVKTDAYGNEQWNHQYGDSLDESASHLEITSDGYVLLGTTNHKGQTDLYLVRVQTNGDTLWTRRIGKSGNDQANSLLVNKDGNFLIAGYTTGTESKDSYWALVSASGSLMWSYSTGSAGDDWIQCAAEVSDGYVFLGTTKDPLLSQGASDMLVLKIKNNGSLVNSAVYGGTGTEIGYDLKLLPDGNLLCLGNSITSGSTTAVTSFYCITISNANSQLKWQKDVAMDGSATEQTLSVDADQNYWITGTLTKTDGDEDIFLMKTDSEGNKLWQQSFGGNGNQTGKSIFITADHGAIITGANDNSGNSMITLIKLHADGTL